MATSKKALGKVKALSDSLDEFSESLEQLYSRSLPETLLSLDNLQQAKLQVALPYLINDLVFIFLKIKGIDPKTHPVVAELDRVREYFEKIQNAEGANKRRTEVDKAAANRFIKHAIAQAQAVAKDDSSNMEVEVVHDSDPGPSKVPNALADAPVKMTSKMIEREKYQQELRGMGSEYEDEDIMEIFDADPVEAAESGSQVISAKTSGKSQGTEENASSKGRRKKPTMDPFAASGFDNNNDDQSSEADDVDEGLQSKKKKSKKMSHHENNGSPAMSDFNESQKIKKRRKKKSKSGVETI